jgi:hypothetical protein
MSRCSLALELRAAYEALSPEIEVHTCVVCPSCEQVCCIDRHGTHEPADLLFLRSLKDEGAGGKSPSPAPPLEDDTLPCRHLGPRGCRLKRWQRPYRCTWFFCGPLLEHMKEASPRCYRRMLRALDRLGALRLRLMEAG